MIAGIASDQVHWISLKEILQSCSPLRRTKITCGSCSKRQERIVSSPRYIVFNLGDQRRNDIESLVDLGELVQQLDHPVVIFQSVKPYPGKAVFSGDQILVKRLMLVPEYDNTQDGHERTIL